MCNVSLSRRTQAARRRRRQLDAAQRRGRGRRQRRVSARGPRAVHARARVGDVAGRAVRGAPPDGHYGAARLHGRRVAVLRRKRQRVTAQRAQTRHYGRYLLYQRVTTLFVSYLLQST